MLIDIAAMENLLPVAGGSLATCQGLKLILALRKCQRHAWRRLLEPGGMPSSHTAVVTSLAMVMGWMYGWTSPFFQLAAVFGGIVIYDALTLRQAVEEHARRLNLICRREGLAAGELRENLGHTPAEALTGALIGALVAVAFIL